MFQQIRRVFFQLYERFDGAECIAEDETCSVECAEQFRDGHYFGCVALTQAVLEAVIRHVWQVKLKKKPTQGGSFDKNLEALHKKKIVSDEWKTKLDEMWADRHSFHHLRPSVEADHLKLEALQRPRHHDE
ncbi:MAG: hypothetical protein ACOVRM_15695, partial [Planctomycetaceae bacterium]